MAAAQTAASTVATRGTPMDTANLIWGMLFGAIGGGYLVYGLRQKLLVPALCGLALGLFGWFVDRAWVTVVVGLALMAVPYFLRF
jgi:hypothetical protein